MDPHPTSQAYPWQTPFGGLCLLDTDAEPFESCMDEDVGVSEGCHEQLTGEAATLALLFEQISLDYAEKHLEPVQRLHLMSAFDQGSSSPLHFLFP